MIDENLSPSLTTTCHSRGYDATSTRDREQTGESAQTVIGTAVPLTEISRLRSSTCTSITLGRPMSEPWWTMIVVGGVIRPSSRR